MLAAIFEGAAAKVREAGGTLAGGHTIKDPEPKYGLAVIGAAHPDHLLRKGGGRPGDILVLTKRLGTGFLVSGRRQGRTSDPDLDAAVAQMVTLNQAAAEVLVDHGVRAATDVTGFGLLGHGLEMARASGSRFVFDAAFPAGPRGRARPCPGRHRDGRRGTQPTVRAPVPRRSAIRSRPSSSPWPTTRRHRAACWPRCRPGSSIRSRSGLDARSVPHWRVGYVENAAEPSVALT